MKTGSLVCVRLLEWLVHVFYSVHQAVIAPNCTCTKPWRARHVSSRIEVHIGIEAEVAPADVCPDVDDLPDWTEIVRAVGNQACACPGADPLKFDLVLLGTSATVTHVFPAPPGTEYKFPPGVSCRLHTDPSAVTGYHCMEPDVDEPERQIELLPATLATLHCPTDEIREICC